MSTTRSYPSATSIDQRARFQSFAVDFEGAGTWTVQSRGSGAEYIVFLRDGRFECSCDSYNFDVIHGPLETCKHGAVVRGIVDGDLCGHCTMPRCRPSCPNRGGE